jgi:hypothetical protein
MANEAIQGYARNNDCFVARAAKKKQCDKELILLAKTNSAAK